MSDKQIGGMDAGLPTVDEISEAMADARLWRGSWAQMGESERNVMRQGAEGVHAMLLKRAEQAYHARGAGREAVAWRTVWPNGLVTFYETKPEINPAEPLFAEPGADTGTPVAEELSGMLAERMIKLAIKIQGPYATFGPPESLARRKKSHEERIEELTGMLTTEFAECLERGTTPPEGLELPWAAETMRLIDVLTPETKGKAFDPDWFLLRQRLEEFERRAATQRAPVEASAIQPDAACEGCISNGVEPHASFCTIEERAPVEQGPSVLTEAQADRYAAFDDWYDAALKRHKRDELPFSQRAACDYAFEAGMAAAPDHAREGALREAAVEEYKKSLDVPELEDFAKGLVIEAQHQRQRWGDEHDKSKEPEEWFWLVGYLAGKGLRSQRDGDMEKFKHHLITGAAVLANWHARVKSERALADGKEGGE